MPVRSRHRRGFTLIEVMTAVVILIILTALAVTYMVYGMGKARMNNAVFDATAMINAAQLRAISRGTPHYVFIHQTSRHRTHPRAPAGAGAPGRAARPANWNTLDLSRGRRGGAGLHARTAGRHHR